MSQKRKYHLIGAFLLAGTASVGCGSGLDAGGTPDLALVTSTCTNGKPWCITNISLQPLTLQTMTLGTSQTVGAAITASSTFDSTVDLTIDRAALDTATLAGTDIIFTLSPSSVTLTPGQTKNFTLTVSALTSAPAVPNQTFNLRGVDAQNRATPVDQSVSLNVKAQIDISYSVPGGNPNAVNSHIWKVGGNPLDSTKNMIFRLRTGGTVFNFINNDTTIAHEIHGNGAPGIVHQPGVTTPPGGTYTPMPNPNANSAFYCHTHLIPPSGGTYAVVFK